MKKLLVALALATTISTTCASPARASEDSITVTSPRCGTIQITTRTNDTQVERQAFVDGLPGVLYNSGTQTWTGVPAGRWSYHFTWWTGGMTGSEGIVDGGWATVAPCPSAPLHKRQEGDVTGDGRADVYGIDTDGRLWFYRSAGSHLRAGVQVGRGFGAFLWAKRTTSANGRTQRLVALRQDGSLWQWLLLPDGRLGEVRRTTTALTPTARTMLTPHNEPIMSGSQGMVWQYAKDSTIMRGNLFESNFSPFDDDGSMLVAKDPAGSAAAMDSAMAWRSDGMPSVLVRRTDGRVQECRHDLSPTAGHHGLTCSAPWGRGWQQMSAFSLPGSVDGDQYTDIITRRSDGNLYLYSGTNGRVRDGVQIGRNWQGIRLLA